MRQVWRSRYVLFNWAYSTNHKRISINYFWFVLFAGVVGMVLATIIRLEMAYPGVGILAGDNAQYLSIVTAHGVIMVFFMAMPMLFGFFGNFLLPTQLGVHDVAFPRMNSAAFWFLPASLLALCQLVCVDRRYQRMNCFNIRELQSLLRNRFSPELITSNKDLTKNSLLGYKVNKTGVEYQNQLPAGYYSLTTPRVSQLNEFFVPTTPLIRFVKSNSTTAYFFTSLNYFLSSLKLFYSGLFEVYKLDNLDKSFKLWFSLSWITRIFDLKYPISGHGNSYNTTPSFPYLYSKIQNSSLIFKNVLTSTNLPHLPSALVFGSTHSRFSELANPELIYKIKIGNYLPDDLYSSNFNFLINSLSKKSISGRKSSWYSSATFLNLLDDFKLTFATNQAPSTLNSLFTTATQITLTPHSTFTTTAQTAINLFLAQTKNDRVLNNWRDLKLSREGWRCRMLAARHQRALFRRYVNENELIWVVERNAKDLLPGWAMITPFSSRTRYTLIGKTDIGVSIVAVTLIASMISSANFLMTYRYLSTLNNRKMRDARSFFSEALIVASWMMIAANPMLILGLFMLLSDRHWGTSFFDYSGGGDTVLFQHMFWFFGHPEVYVIILPCFGITNTLLSFYLRKRISARASLLYSLYTIAFLGFFVWGHHMYMVGLAHTTRMLYSTLTVMISVPAATKIMHWLVTFVNSAVHFELPLVLTLFFIFYFVSGGISGMAVAHTGMDILFHDTFYVIGHFHVMLAGSLMFSGFAAFYFYLPSLFGIRYSRLFAYLHVFYYSLGQLFTVIPMIWLGYLGMPRRVLDYPAAMGGWHSLISSAHMLTVAGILTFVIMLFDSLRKQKAYTIKTFGVGRYNTRLNFYLYQNARNYYWLSKHFTLTPIRMPQHIKNNNNVNDVTFLDSGLFFYSFTPRTFGKNWLYI